MPPSFFLPGLPPEVDAAFESALAKDRGRRLEDIELWGASFAELLEKAPPDPAADGWPLPPRDAVNPHGRVATKRGRHPHLAQRFGSPVVRLNTEAATSCVSSRLTRRSTGRAQIGSIGPAPVQVICLSQCESRALSRWFTAS